MRRMNFRSLACRLALVTGALSSIAAIACSGGAGTTGGGAPIPAEQLGKTFVDKLCAAIQTCCNQNGFSDELKTCAQGAAAVQADFDKDRSKHPEYTYDAQKAGNCIAKVANAFGTCNPKSAAIENDPDCDGFLRGTKPAGASCTTSKECAANESSCTGRSGSSGGTDGGASTSAGICITLKRPAEGDPCFSYDEAPKADKVYGRCEYDDAFYCDRSSKTCKARGGPGTSCAAVINDTTTSLSQACAKDSTCDQATKKCVALAAVGESCSSTSSTLGCVSTAYCDTATSKCAARKAAGEACTGTNSECVHGCDTNTKKCRSNEVSRKTCSGDLE